MQLDVWHITGDGFHLGRRGLGQEESGNTIPSDSLMAALIARLVALRGAAAADAFVAELQAETPPFALSSAFPRAGGVRFFPTPLLPPPPLKAGGPKPKDLKRARWISDEAFRGLLGGQSLAALMSDGRTLHGGQAVLTKAEFGQLPAGVQADGKIWEAEKRPRVTLGRAAQNSQLYFTGRTVFHQDCGLWLGVRWLKADDALAQTLADLMAELGDAGVGGERSNGFGRCRIEKAGKLELPEAGSGPWVSLSHYLPREDEMEAIRADAAAYAVEAIGGWIESPVSKSERRRAVRMLAEGAVLGPVKRAVPGQIVDVQPDYNGARPLGHPVWRSGLALAVGLSSK